MREFFSAYVPMALLIVLIVLTAPWRRTSRFTVRRVSTASPEAVWAALCASNEFDEATGDRPPSYRFDIISMKRVSGEADLCEAVIDRSGGRRSLKMPVRFRVLEREPCSRFVIRVESQGAVVFPEGPESFHRIELTAKGGGTAIAYIDEIRTNNLLHRLMAWRRLLATAKAGEQIVATGRHPLAAPRSRLARQGLPLLLTALAVAGFSLGFGSVLVGLVLAVLVLVHEFGHWLAMRITGQPSARIMLIPFFGGIAIPARPHASDFAQAFCSLMGPGFSAILCGALLLASSMGSVENAIEVGGETSRLVVWPMVCLQLAVAAGLLNVLQLAPILPLDGGQVFRALLESFGRRTMRVLMFALSVCAIGLGVWSRDWIWALIAVLGLSGLQKNRASCTAKPPMSRLEAGAIAAGYAAAVVVLLSPVVEMARARPMFLRMLAFDLASGPDALDDEVPDEGSETIPPRFTLAAASGFGVGETTFVAGDFANGTRFDRRVWGAADRPGLFGFVQIEDFSREKSARRDRAGLRSSLDDYLSSLDAGWEYDVPAKDGSFLGAYGVMDSLTLSLADGRVSKSCRAFHGFAGRGADYVVGMFCRDGAPAATPSGVSCLMQGLRIASLAPTVASDARECERGAPELRSGFDR